MGGSLDCGSDLCLGTRPGPAKLLLIGTFRPVDVALPEHPLKFVKQDLLVRRLCREIELNPLSESDVAAYLAPNSPEAAVPDGLVRLLHRHSDGNPLFMVAALEHMAARGLISREDDTWKLNHRIEEIELGVPENLRKMIEAQIERLTRDEQQALEVASIIGIVFSSRITAAAAKEDEERFGNLFEGLSRRGLIIRHAGFQRLPDATVSERYEFIHALYREVFYKRQPTASKSKLHQNVGKQLEQLFASNPHDVAAELANHFEQGRDWPRAVRYLQIVAENAGRRYAHGLAATTLEHALELTNKLPETERASIECAILTKLATMRLVSFDMRVIETCETLAERAAYYGLIDVQVQALVEMAYPLSWVSTEQCLRVLERALELTGTQKDLLLRARTRASCLVRRIWAAGWNDADAEECRKALGEIRRVADRTTTAWHLIDYNFIQWVSSEYRDAQRDAVESLSILLDSSKENPYLSTAYWLSQFIMPWSLLFLGDWGEMLRELRAGISIPEKNEDSYRAQTLRVYQAWLHLQAMDFNGVVSICQSVLPSVKSPSRTPWRRFCLVLLGSAEGALGEYERAREHLTNAASEMDQRKVIHDWYNRMLLEYGFTELYLAQQDLPQARSHANHLLSITQATAERTWQAWAWEANARVALAERDLEKARQHMTKALLCIDGRELPLAAWRVHPTGADLSAEVQSTGLVEYHREMSRAIILKLADSLAADEPLRKTFLSATPVRNVLEMSKQ